MLVERQMTPSLGLVSSSVYSACSNLMVWPCYPPSSTAPSQCLLLEHLQVSIFFNLYPHDSSMILMDLKAVMIVSVCLFFKSTEKSYPLNASLQFNSYKCPPSDTSSLSIGPSILCLIPLLHRVHPIRVSALSLHLGSQAECARS